MQADWLLFSFVPWRAKRNRGHHLAEELVGAGERVLWVDPPAAGGARRPALSELSPGLSHLTGPGREALTPLGQPRWLRALRPLLEGWREAERRQVTWVQLPGLAQAALTLPRDLLVYDALDDWRHSSRGGVRLEVDERLLARHADLVLAISAPVQERFARLGAAPRLLPNACRPEDWAEVGALDPPAELSALPSPRLLFCGSLDEHLDVEAIEAAARLPASVVLVGPCPDPRLRARLEGIAGVHLFGTRPYAELPALLAGADACLLPWRATPFNAARDSSKLYEYLAAGRPVAASATPQAERFAEALELADPAAGPGGFAAACARALERGAPPWSGLESATWSARASQLRGWVRAAWPRP